MFKTETHLHTSEVSPCGKLTAADMVSRYKAAGYHTLFVTDHLARHIVDRWGDLTWAEKIDRTFAGYERAKAAGDACGLTVLCGVELHLNTSPNDYLLYNFDRAFLTAREDLFDLTPAAFYAYAKQHGVTVVQAHPLRDGICVPTVDCADALEAFNPNPRHENHSALACELAKLYKLPISGGSDAHREEDVARGGVLTATPILSAADYVYLLKNGAVQPIEGV